MSSYFEGMPNHYGFVLLAFLRKAPEDTLHLAIGKTNGGRERSNHARDLECGKKGLNLM